MPARAAWIWWRGMTSLSRSLLGGLGGQHQAAKPGTPNSVRSVFLSAVRQASGAHAIHTLPLGGAGPRHAWPQAGVAAAAREVQRFARGAPPLVAIPLVRRKLHAVAHSLSSDERSGGAADAGPNPVLSTAPTAAADQTTAAAGRPAVGAAAAAAAGAGAAGAGSAECDASTSSSGAFGTGAAAGSSAEAGATSSSSTSSSDTRAGSGAAASSSSSSGGGGDGAQSTSSGSGSTSISGGGGGPEASPPPVVLQSGASMLPHPDKAHRGGEDAFFISEPPLALGVADGVGGWAEIGVDAGAYARLLMTHAKEEAEALLSAAAAARAAGAAPAPPLSPQTVLERAYYRTNVQGSSTVCILALNGSTLSASNLGDSGFVVVRGGAPAFQSPQQQHNFNFPYQLGSADGGASDHPSSAMRFELTVQPGDIIITGTDGLWDNVFADEASTIVSRCRAQGDGPEAAAHTLCRYARMRATDPKHHSPFSYAAIQAGYVFLGGKLDDITVVVSYVALGSSKL